MSAHTGLERDTGARIVLETASGLLIEASTSPHDGLLEEFYQDYDKAFVLENEKEGLEGFAACLALNAGDAYVRLRGRYGPFREFVVVLRARGERVAGANFIVFPWGEGQGAGISVNLNYVFVNDPFRRRGLLRRLMGDLPALALGLFAHTNAHDIPRALVELPTGASSALPVYTFIEQNDPYRMSQEAYKKDTELTGLDQMERILMWGRLGARIVDFDYVQPPLSHAQGPDDTLAFAVLGCTLPTLDACILRKHLECFFGISVLKGAPLGGDPTAAAQIARLSGMCDVGQMIRLLPLGKSLPVADAHRPASLRAALRGGAA